MVCCNFIHLVVDDGEVLGGHSSGHKLHRGGNNGTDVVTAGQLIEDS